MKKMPTLLILLLPMWVFGSYSFLGPQVVPALSIQNTGDNAEVIVHLNNGKDRVAMKGISAQDIDKLAFNDFGNHLVGITFSCGSGCYMTTIINTATGVTAAPFGDAYDIDAEHGLVVYPYDDQTLVVANIFDPTKKMLIRRNFSPIDLISLQISFSKTEPILNMDYPEGANYKDCKEQVKLNYIVL